MTYRNNLYYRENRVTQEIITKKYQNNLEFQQKWDLFAWQDFELAVRIKQDYNYSGTLPHPLLPRITGRIPAYSPINLGFLGYYQGSTDYLRLVEIKGEAEK